ncbi:exodeoxyribonuclease V subunit beta [Borrelia anserina]|uniref:DNA 3'-5' helicase n=2 Tax=Borrelia anserina TaxID=143 RepID=W5SNV9_BORAN|nr:exodeoxyribonuclease V subunit beta [Borrelia anserina]AHH08602.1 Exodeoxyribonuclease V beta chain [Borrelia anserina BA2]APR65065.1 exodeoxyribonuclease V subunit beta [Borrelia anserina Es]UPA06992.1 exodeoxyribonuclease V subunit beta [Borrelia anserina]
MREITDKIKYNSKILIEASAGTGKTYTLENIITNLLIEKTYSPSEILVLTFTKKATEEMYIRILKSIENAYHNSKTDKSLKTIYEQSNKIFISTINKFALYSLNNFQIETENFSKYSVKESFTSEIDKIVYEFLRKADSLKKELKIKDNEFEIFKSKFKNTKDMTQYLRQEYKKDKIQELENWIENQIILKKILINKDRLICKYNSIIEELNKMTMQTKRAFLNKYNQGIKIPEIQLSHEKDIIKIIDILTNNKFLSKIIEANLNKNAILLPKELKIQTALRELSYETNTNKEDKNKLKRYINLKVEYKILKYIERELKNTINITNTIDQKHIMLNFKKQLESYNNKLLNSIKNRYKIILIDEAQDLDIIQIAIFEVLNSFGIKLVFIADPKQIIYTFRNADVSFYNQGIKDKIKDDARITLFTNYRSNKKLVEPLNIMFDNIYNKAVTSKIEQIKFIKSKPEPKNDENKIFINDQEIEAINIIETEKNDNVLQKTALTIKYLLTNGKIYDNNKLRQIKESDIKVLCRTSKEIDLIDRELKNQNIKTNKLEKSFLKTKEFNEIFYLIKCLDRKQNFQTLNYILTSKIINLPWEIYLSLLENDKIKHIEEALSDIIYLLENQEIILIKAIEEIVSKKDLWLNLAKILNNTKFTEFAKSKKSYREILINEKKFEELKNYETSLDFISKIYYEDKNIESLICTLEELILNQDTKQDEDKTTTQSDQSIEILTIHKSKGLSMNIVFLIGDTQLNNNLLKKSDTFYKFCSDNKIKYDFLKLKENKQFAKQKILNEEKNIFYVGTTRSRFALFIINKGTIINKMLELAEIKTIGGINLDFNVYNLIKTRQFNKLDINENKKIKLIPPTPINKYLFRKEYTYSYTSLTSIYKSKHNANLATREDETYDNNATCTEESLPKGKDIGNILHAIMKDINFSDAKDSLNDFKKSNISIVQKRIEYFNSKLNTPKIQEMLIKMVYNILSTKIRFINARLCDIQELQKEMEFLIKIDTKIHEEKSLIKNYNKTNLILNEGYIKGIIDLIFKINNKVYILDYKTNYLGENLKDYNLTNLKNKIKQEQYDLQYKIYTLGVKKILFKNIKEYNEHFGGVIYLFTRAFQKNIKEQSKIQNGIYFSIPNFKELDLEQIHLQFKS